MDKADCTTNRFFDCSRNFPQSVKRISTIDLFLEADLENMLVENSRLTIPEVGSKGGSYRSDRKSVRVGKECVSTCRSRVSTYHYKNKDTTHTNYIVSTDKKKIKHI